jgi:type II secretory pathway pseudopilin PulG
MSTNYLPATHPKRPVWPWLLACALLMVGVIIIFVASFAVSAVLASVADARSAREAEGTVLALDAAYQNADCAAFQSVVDDALADTMVGGAFDCDTWIAQAESLSVDGKYNYTVDVTSATAQGDRATVSTTESTNDANGQTLSTRYRYMLERSGRDWVIVSYDER